MTDTYVIAEAGVNHNGSLDMAKALIDVAAEAGADAVKFQTFKTENVASQTAPKADYQKQNTGEQESQFDMLKRLELSEDMHDNLIQYCQERDITFLTTPFDIESFYFLYDKFQLNMMKVSSGDLTNAPLLLELARYHQSLILSTGMGTLGEIEQALSVLAYGFTEKSNQKPHSEGFQKAFASWEGQAQLYRKVTLLHCTTAYPTPFTDVNLKAMDTLQSAFGLRVGLSDHTNGLSIPIAATARGGSVIEKHFTLDRNLPGPDHKASLEPKELKAMVQSIREVEQAMGSSLKTPVSAELKNKIVARKSIVAFKNIKKGELFRKDNVTTKRPGTGNSPFYYWDLLGKKAERDYVKDEVIR